MTAAAHSTCSRATVEPGAAESEALSLAWSEPDPDPGRIESFLAQVEPKT